MPTRSRARANACDPRISAPMSRRSKSSEPENRSKTSDGPDSKRPPQSFTREPFHRRAGETPRKAGWSFCLRLGCPHFDRQTDQVNEAEGVLLVVAGAHGEA